MSLSPALDALKRRDFAAARALVGGDMASFTAQHFLIKSLAEMAMRDWRAALPTLVLATGRFADDALFWLNRGVVEENLGMIDAAIASQARCVALNPKQAEAYGNLANLYRKHLRFAESEQAARQAVAHGAARGSSLNCLGLALCRQGKFTEARVAYEQALQAEPDDAKVLVNLANLEIDLLHFDAAWEYFAAARALDDGAIVRHDEALARLLAGEYETGYRLFESRIEIPHKMRMYPTSPRWRGESLTGKKLLIYAEQGFGDVIQFCRFGKFISDGELVWAVPRNLVRLLAGRVRGTILCETDPMPDCDYHVPMMSLPLVTGKMEPAVWQGSAPYLTAPPSPVLPTGKHKRKIGLVWAGSPTHERNHERSLPLKLFAPLLQTVQADFYAPFVGEVLNDIGDFPVTRLDHLITDFADTAAFLRQMDCVITVDTAIAHLAGALGVPAYVLLSQCPDWRWGVAGGKTDWYEPVTLLRQEKYGDWGTVVERLRKKIST